MLSEHKNVTISWFDPGSRYFEAYKAIVGFREATDGRPFIAEKLHIIEDGEILYYKPNNLWKGKILHAYPRKFNIDLNTETFNPSQ